MAVAQSSAFRASSSRIKSKQVSHQSALIRSRSLHSQKDRQVTLSLPLSAARLTIYMIQRHEIEQLLQPIAGQVRLADAHRDALAHGIQRATISCTADHVCHAQLHSAQESSLVGCVVVQVHSCGGGGKEIVSCGVALPSACSSLRKRGLTGLVAELDKAGPAWPRSRGSRGRSRRSGCTWGWSRRSGDRYSGGGRRNHSRSCGRPSGSRI